MRKIVSIFLSILLTFSVGINVVAAKTAEQNEHDELIKLACEVFPEYAEKIRNESPVTYSAPNSESADAIVFSETRRVSDTESLSITQLARGALIITSSEVEYGKISITDSSSSGVGSDRIGNASFKVTCSEATGVFVYKSVGFIIHSNGSGYFTSYGSTSGTSGVAIGSHSESSNGISYYLTFNMSGAKKYLMSFHLTIFNGSVHATVR